MPVSAPGSASQGIYRSGRGARVTETTFRLNEKLVIGGVKTK